MTRQEVEGLAATLPPRMLAKFRAYQVRGVFIERRGDGLELHNTCYAWARATRMTWVRVRPRRKYASVTLDMITLPGHEDMGDEAFATCWRIAESESAPKSRIVMASGYVWIQSASIHRAGNLADLLLAVVRKGTGC